MRNVYFPLWGSTVRHDRDSSVPITTRGSSPNPHHPPSPSSVPVPPLPVLFTPFSQISQIYPLSPISNSKQKGQTRRPQPKKRKKTNEDECIQRRRKNKTKEQKINHPLEVVSRGSCLPQSPDILFLGLHSVGKPPAPLIYTLHIQFLFQKKKNQYHFNQSTQYITYSSKKLISG
jgi:hypothetical protein